jgi:xylulokinase
VHDRCHGGVRERALACDTSVVIVGVDVGTQSLKAVVCDDAMRVVGEASRRYAIDFPQPGWAEQDPSLWEAALAPAIGGALAAAGCAPADVAALGVSGQLDGCIAVDAACPPLHPCLIWMDRRAAMPSLDDDDFLARTGQVADPSHMAAKIRWLASRVAAARFHQPVTYLVERLTGAAVIDPSLASTTMLFELSASAWSPPLASAFGVDLGELPVVTPAHAIAGHLHTRGAALSGLPAGLAVAVGTGDDFATPLGAGLVAPGRVACVIGTAEVVGAIHPSPVVDRGRMVETHAYPTGGFFVENPGWVSGGALTWLGEVLGEPDPAVLVSEASLVAPGADGVSFLPALGGAMTPSWHARARGAFYGFTPAHGRRHVVRAVLDGLAFAACDVIDRLHALGVATDDVLLLGGGGQSAPWAQIRADATGRPHAIAAHAETCAIGAAMLAAVAVGAQPDLAAAAALAPAPRLWIEPASGHRGAYEDARDRARALFAALRPLF